MEVAIDKIIVGPRIRKKCRKIKSLAKSIAELGLLHPIPVDSSMNLIAGVRRLEACKLLGWEKVPVTVCCTIDDRLKAVRAELHENIERDELTPLEQLTLADEIQAILKPEAEAKRLANLEKDNPGKTPECSQKPHSKKKKPERTEDKAAKAVGTSQTRLRKVRAVANAAKEDPALFGPVADEMEATGKVDPAYQDVKKRQPNKPEHDTKPKAVPATNPTIESICREQEAVRSKIIAAVPTADGAGIDLTKANRLVDQLLRTLRAEPKPSEMAERLYELYPRKVGKPVALKAIGKALKKVLAADLVEAVTAYAVAVRDSDQKYIPHPSTWFNQERWTDDRAEWARIGGGSGSSSSRLSRPKGRGEVYDPQAGHVPFA